MSITPRVQDKKNIQCAFATKDNKYLQLMFMDTLCGINNNGVT